MENGYRLARLIIGAVGAVYVLIGLLGFAFTGLEGFAAREGEHLLGIFEINPLHNLVHLGVGLALLGALRLRPAGTAAVAATIGVVFVLLAIFGPVIAGTEANILALNTADHFLHAATALSLLGAAYLLRQSARTGHESVGYPRAA